MVFLLLSQFIILYPKTMYFVFTVCTTLFPRCSIFLISHYNLYIALQYLLLKGDQSERQMTCEETTFYG